MEEVKEYISNCDFFKSKKIEIFNIQDYGRKSKFKVKIDDKYYTLILKEKTIKLYTSKIKILGDEFKKLIGFKYLSKDKKILVLDYFGNNNGIDIVKLENNNLDIFDDKYSLQLKKYIDVIHSKKCEYIDFSSNKFTSWKEYYLDEITKKIEKAYEYNLINDIVKKKLTDKLEISSNAYIDFKPTLIHGDITPLNVCIDVKNEKLYLIDYDDFRIGDPLMDISRIINCKDMSRIFYTLVEKYYYKYEENINHLFYTLRVNVNWYSHIIDRKQEDIYDLNKAKKDVNNVVERILEYVI